MREPGHRIADRPVAGAAAEIALERRRQILPLRLIQRGGGHDHARRAETALETLRVVERRLHRMEGCGCGPVEGAGSGSPSIVVTARPSAWNAGSRQEWIGSPSR